MAYPLDAETIDAIAHRMVEILRMPTRRQKNCQHCARPFIPTNAAQKFCCAAHQNAAAQKAHREKSKSQ